MHSDTAVSSLILFNQWPRFGRERNFVDVLCETFPLNMQSHWITVSALKKTFLWEKSLESRALLNRSTFSFHLLTLKVCKHIFLPPHVSLILFKYEWNKYYFKQLDQDTWSAWLVILKPNNNLWEKTKYISLKHTYYINLGGGLACFLVILHRSLRLNCIWTQ